MNVLTKIWFLVLLFLGSFASSGQEFYKSLSPVSLGANSLNYKLTGKRHYFEPSYHGSPYLYDEWQLGSVLLENGDRYDSLYLNLNTLADELVWYNKRTGDLVDLDKFIIDEFTFSEDQNNILLFRKVYSDKSPRGEHYYNILYEGELKLWFLHKTIIAVTSTYKDVWGNMLNSEYDLVSQYLLVLPDGEVEKIKNSRRTLIRLFPEHRRVVRRLLARNGIDYRNLSPSEMARAVNLIDQEIFSN